MSASAELKKWPLSLGTYTPGEVQVFCVQNAVWQNFRLSMKGKPTTRKLVMLHIWRTNNPGCQMNRALEVQVDNYLNALKRGGQLNMDLEVQR